MNQSFKLCVHSTVNTYYENSCGFFASANGCISIPSISKCYDRIFVKFSYLFHVGSNSSPSFFSSRDTVSVLAKSDSIAAGGSQ